jgi:signal transduction histidine kinase
VQYTSSGTIRVDCSEQGNQVVVKVEDTGAGMLAEQLPHLFARPKLGSLLHGKGISLCLARQLAKLMGAEIVLISSQINHGSTFAIMFAKPVSADVNAPKAEVAA